MAPSERIIEPPGVSVPHKQASLDVVDFAEFFLGGGWNHRVFRVDNQDGFVGISISAYGPALCTCRVVFRESGGETFLERYLDFEMADILTRPMPVGNVETQAAA